MASKAFILEEMKRGRKQKLSKQKKQVWKDTKQRIKEAQETVLTAIKNTPQPHSLQIQTYYTEPSIVLPPYLEDYGFESKEEYDNFNWFILKWFMDYKSGWLRKNKSKGNGKKNSSKNAKKNQNK